MAGLAGKGVAGGEEVGTVLGDGVADGGEEVAFDGGVDAEAEGCVEGLRGEAFAAAGEAEVGRGVGQAEEGDGTEDVALGEEREVGEGRAGDGGQDVDGDGADAEVAEGEGEVDAVGLAFAHTDDAAGADVHAHTAGGAEGLNLLGLGVGGAEGGEEGGGGFQVAVVARDAGLEEAAQGGLVEQAEGGAEFQGGLAAEEADEVADAVELGRGGAAAGVDDGEAADTGGLVGARVAEALLGGDEAVDVAGGAVVGGLGAPLAVLGATAALAVDDGATVKEAGGAVAGEAFGLGEEGVFGAGGPGQEIVTGVKGLGHGAAGGGGWLLARAAGAIIGAGGMLPVKS